MLWRSSEALIVRLQAISRGFLVRQTQEARRRYLISQTPAAVTIQVRPPLLQRQNIKQPQIIFISVRSLE